MPNDYSKIPFIENGRSIKGCDCWGLVRIFYKENYNIDLPIHLETDARDLKNVARAMAQNRNKWHLIDKPKYGDVALMTARVLDVAGKKRRLPVHVGVMIDNLRVMHTEKLSGCVVQKIKDPVIMPRIISFYRFENGCCDT